MPASSKRSARVKMRRQDAKHTGVVRKAKKQQFDTSGESDAVAQDLGNRKKFHEHDLANITPMNSRQEDFLRAYFEGVPMLLAVGPAGTAKSFLSLFCGLSDVFREGSGHDKLIVIRSTVPTRDSGFLPGTQEEKNEPYEAPYEQICQELLPAFKNGYNHLKALGYIQFASTAHQRGITWNNAIIVVDEFSSCNYHELATLATRVGQNCRIIFCGDLKQSDLQGTKEESGYEKFMRVVEGMPKSYYDIVEYQLGDIVRSGLAKQFLLSDFYNG